MNDTSSTNDVDDHPPLNDIHPVKKKAKTGDDCKSNDDTPGDIPRIEWSSTTPQEFFFLFVSTRKPCVVLGFPLPLAETVQQEMLKLKDCTVQLEKRKDPTERFGQQRSSDRQVTRDVASFVRDCFSTRNPPESIDLLYLSTQEPPLGKEQQQKPFLGPPCDRLLTIPRTPLPLAGHLDLHSCHLWMGVASEANSGLHHDFHDNFYMLLAGSKTFHLFPPTDAPHLAVKGEVECIHPNGLISYVDNPTYADGTPKDVDEKGVDDESNEEEEVTIGRGFDYSSDDEGDSDFLPGAAKGARKEDSVGSKDDFSEVDYKDTVTSDDDDDNDVADNFCWLDPTIAKDKIVSTFPNYVKATESTVTLQAGEVLYLPASWFHCVVSRGCTGENRVHMALNHWYKPPDDLRNFQCPYTNYSNNKSGGISSTDVLQPPV